MIIKSKEKKAKGKEMCFQLLYYVTLLYSLYLGHLLNSNLYVHFTVQSRMLDYTLLLPQHNISSDAHLINLSKVDKPFYTKHWISHNARTYDDLNCNSLTSICSALHATCDAINRLDIHSFCLLDDTKFKIYLSDCSGGLLGGGYQKLG